MPIKSVLVHLADDKDHLSRLGVGYDLARRHQAHLTVLYIATPVSMPAAIEGRGASAAYLQEAVEIAREKARAIEAEFNEWCGRHRVSCRFETAEGDHLALLARRSHYADIAVVSQTEPRNLEEFLTERLPDHLAMAGSCPTLVLPHGYAGEGCPGRRVLVAWTASREASRAARDALPLLSRAEEVRVVTVGAREAERESLAEICAWLARHRIQARPVPVPRIGRSVARALIEAAAEFSADLMVMGGYGHSRLHELFLGGASRELLSRGPIPLLMSH